VTLLLPFSGSRDVVLPTLPREGNEVIELPWRLASHSSCAATHVAPFSFFLLCLNAQGRQEPFSFMLDFSRIPASPWGGCSFAL